MTPDENGRSIDIDSSVSSISGIRGSSNGTSRSSGGGVDMRYVLAFGIAGILFDCVSLSCFYPNDRGHCHPHLADSDGDGADTDPDTDACGGGGIMGVCAGSAGDECCECS